jgi:hypothetical protein
VLRRSFVVTICGFVIVAVTASGASAKTVSPDQWAPKFCTALSKWQDTLNQDSSDAQSALSGDTSNLKQAKSELVSFLGKSVTNSNQTVAALKDAGTPKSTNGAKIANEFVSGMQNASKLFQAAKTKVQKASTSSLTKFNAVTSSVSSALNKGGDAIEKSFTDTASLDTKGELADALQNEPSCAFLAEGSTSTTTPGGS